MYDYGVFIGRFQPLHEGHVRVIEEAFKTCKKLIILIGSAGSARTLRNPWTWEERAKMIDARFKDANPTKYVCRPLEDMTYRDQEWLAQVHQIVHEVVEIYSPEWSDRPPTVALIGSQKDETGYYLDLFPRWASVPVEHKNPLNSTEVRRMMFERELTPDTGGSYWVHDRVFNVLSPMYSEGWWAKLKAEFNWVKTHKAKFTNLEHPPIFQTVDSLVIQSGHILLVERGKNPGLGMYAIPGGYLNSNETIDRATYRELREETKIDVSDTRLRAAFVKRQVFDEVNRSSRGRVITTASLFKLPNERSLPRVKGSDDAKKAFWVPLNEVKQDRMFEDHYHIIKTLVAGE